MMWGRTSMPEFRVRHEQWAAERWRGGFCVRRTLTGGFLNSLTSRANNNEIQTPCHTKPCQEPCHTKQNPGGERNIAVAQTDCCRGRLLRHRDSRRGFIIRCSRRTGRGGTAAAASARMRASLVQREAGSTIWSGASMFGIAIHCNGTPQRQPLDDACRC